ncbi:LutC/YkgG family protein [Thiocystis violacea]|uniref:LutC/YkgG family protein n=1 Tax=Thiocystis violacea TaxID=13725 RepID=UPI001906A93C|nr:lactate utilization protein [Thiocystis violacea]MBK1723086.1 hypothetical protein [Thiocystis violacea]
MTDARRRILQGLRVHAAAKGRAPAIPVRRFEWSQEEAVDRLEQMMQAVRTEVHRVDDAWPQRLAEELTRASARRLYYGAKGPLTGELTAGWPDSAPELVAWEGSIETTRDRLFDEADASFTSARAGIAETGSLVLWPTPAEPRLLSLVPPIHCVLLERRQIVSTLHALMVEERWAAQMPTNALLISGPSKSADIEQTLAYGVHGPERLILLIR